MEVVGITAKLQAKLMEVDDNEKESEKAEEYLGAQGQNGTGGRRISQANPTGSKT